MSLAWRQPRMKSNRGMPRMIDVRLVLGPLVVARLEQKTQACGLIQVLNPAAQIWRHCSTGADEELW